MTARKVKQPAPRRANPGRQGAPGDPDFYQLRLFVAGQTSRSQAALRNLEHLCETHLRGKYRIEVVDLLVNPQLARGDQIFAVPTLVRQLPRASARSCMRVTASEPASDPR